MLVLQAIDLLGSRFRGNDGGDAGMTGAFAGMTSDGRFGNFRKAVISGHFGTLSGGFRRYRVDLLTG